MQPESHRVVGGANGHRESDWQAEAVLRFCACLLVYSCLCVCLSALRQHSRDCPWLFACELVCVPDCLLCPFPCCVHHTPCTYSIGTCSIGIADAPPAPFYSLHLISLIAHRRLLSETKAPSAASITVILRRAMAVTAPKR